MFDCFRPVVGNYSIDKKCSNKLCNRSVIVPAQLNDNAVVYCDECKNAMKAKKVNEKEHHKYARVGDKTVPVRISACYCSLINLSRGFNDEFVVCGSCKEAEKELKPRYKWSWKLNKAVRL